MENTENMVEFITNDTFCTVTFTNRKHINRIEKLYGDHKKDFVYMTKNADGSICAKIPLSWLKITPPTKRELSEAEKEILRQRLAESRKH